MRNKDFHFFRVVAMVIFLSFPGQSLLAASDLLTPESSRPVDKLNDPWDFNQSDENFSSSAAPYGSIFPAAMIRVYQNHLRPAFGHGCPSFPSCSSYMMQSITQHGMIAGYILGLDRLLHEADEMAHGRWIMVDGEWKVDDPILNNTFWW